MKGRPSGDSLELFYDFKFATARGSAMTLRDAFRSVAMTS
jgi:hypothetical protein